ncbi:aminoglycoside 6-adenylyltransferase [Nocardioides ginsengisegetis]|uniref:Aminoglycoside 6-adenylyltransferase n=1 Tax=Nocardioides ginsengisegetis TaxID=661491 RepID=A0A7W3J349_9ACTN|nr:aminoglycoside 6-adenylyltransferase [Nocardioides ginsengisegetis]MBA8805443.1 aminoglycoside 6-adenylyltransferase [Nocardioides ginsengisegetis]
MEDPDELIETILDWAQGDSRVSAVVLTGSRARADRVDRWSDLDVELIGPEPRELARQDEWLKCVGQAMVILPFDLEDLVTRLVVLPRGRKIDFSLWPEVRITTMVESGLNDLYNRGYQVLLDKTALTTGLPAATGIPTVPPRPEQAEFTRLESEFWFEATQVAVYLARADLWVVKFRENTMHSCLLTMLGWQAQFDRRNPRFTWHIGHHMDEWLSASDYDAAGAVFTHFDPQDTIRGISAAMDLFESATAAAASELFLEHRPELAQDARTHVLATLAPLRNQA